MSTLVIIENAFATWAGTGNITSNHFQNLECRSVFSTMSWERRMTIIVDGFTLDEIREAHKVAAQVVSLFGDRYLPIFQRLHIELKKLENKMAIKEVALNVASGIRGNDNGK